VIAAAPSTPRWIISFSRWLTPGRLRAHAIVLALCLWGVCAIDFATPGMFDRAGNLKFQDFIQFPISARLIAQGRSGELYNDQVLAHQIRAIAGRDTKILLRYFYGPQVALLFLPLVGLPFLAQAAIWVLVSLLIYFGCVYLLWRTCPHLRAHAGLVAIGAIAYPPLFHFFVRGQMSAVVLLCFTISYLAFRGGREWLAGIALGFLFFKPPFLVAIPLIFILARAWRPLLGLVLSVIAQFGFTLAYFGPAVMRSYFRMLLASALQPGTTQLSLSSIQMHSLHTFWELLIPWPRAASVLYLLTVFCVIAGAALIWKSSSSLALRFSALLLAAVLVNPHLYIYDLLALAPAFLLLADWILADPENLKPWFPVLLYLAFVLPLFGPISRWTHLQLSVIVFAALLWSLYREAAIET
jgi:Glycosyltransferase family 87